MNQTYLTTDQLAEIIHYDSRTIRTRLKDAVLLEGVHYLRPVGGRKLLFINEAIELTKSYGGTDGHKYVNGVLDKLAAKLRPVEVEAKRAARKA